MPGMRTRRSYRWIIDRARSGEPVPIDTTRRDMSDVVDYLLSVDGRGLAIQCDTAANLMWITRTEEPSRA